MVFDINLRKIYLLFPVHNASVAEITEFYE